MPTLPSNPDADPAVEDARGLLCPIPVIRLAKRLSERACGESVLLLADDPAALEDVRAWCKGHRQELVEAGEDGPTFRILVRRIH